METKEIRIGIYNFKIRKERSFKKMCDLQAKMLKKEPIVAVDLVKTDAKVEVLKRDEAGNMIGREFMDISDEILEEMSDKEGKELLDEIIKYRGTSDFQKGEKSTKKKQRALSGKLRSGS